VRLWYFREPVTRICEEIVRRRNCGLVRCGTGSGAVSVTDVAGAFGLSIDPLCYREISESTARAIATHVLNKDLAYQVEVIPSDEARELVSQFFELCCTPDWRFFSNGDFALKASSSWTPATESTFDTGVLIVAGDRSGCLWVEDED
jgi:hypothetical protein